MLNAVLYLLFCWVSLHHNTECPMLNVIMLNVAMQNAIMLIVVAPFDQIPKRFKFFHCNQTSKINFMPELI
jgi:hypothetical protein